MESQTGRIKALVGIERKDSAQWQETGEFCKPQPTGLFTTMSMLAVLESGKVHLNDTVDTGNGIYAIDEDNVIKDHNCHRVGMARFLCCKVLPVAQTLRLCVICRKRFRTRMISTSS